MKNKTQLNVEINCFVKWKPKKKVSSAKIQTILEKICSILNNEALSFIFVLRIK